MEPSTCWCSSTLGSARRRSMSTMEDASTRPRPPRSRLGLRMIGTVAVYCASSRRTDPAFPDAARRLGAHLARSGVAIVYGGGAVGSMGALAEGALAEGGRVVGVLPRFMAELEWGHAGVTELRLV